MYRRACGGKLDPPGPVGLVTGEVAGEWASPVSSLAMATEAQSLIQALPYVVELVNLFDQASGSGRNVAIVIRPTG